MNEEYAEYLQSEEWQKKRTQRLAISGFRCSACTAKKAIHVHHLTYERIFNEEMGDLLPLCKDHHEAAERLVRDGKITRQGNVLLLATETIRLILSERPAAAPKTKTPASVIRGNMASDPRFQAALSLPRKKFKQRVKKLFGKNTRIVINACMIYDAQRSGHPAETQRSKRRRSEGFSTPSARWDNLTESERHARFINSRSGW